MAPRQVNQQAAESTVFENFGLSNEDIGVGENELGSGNEGSGNEDSDHDFEDGGVEDNDGAGQQRGRQQQNDDDEDADLDPQQGRQQQRQPQRQQPRVSHTQNRQPGQGQPQQQPGQRPIPRSAEVHADARGNLVGTDGRIVARAGKEARFYQNMQTAQRELQTQQFSSQRLSANLTRAVEIGQELQRRVEAAENQMTGIKQLGMQPQEVLEASQLYKEAQANPISVLKKLLTRAAANGIDLTQLGMQGGADLKTFAEQMREEMKRQMQPLQERMNQENQTRTQQTEQTERLRQTETHIMNWFGQNQEALPYIDVFKAVIANPQFRDMSLGEIWQRIQLNQLRQQQQRNGGGTNRQRPSLPNGRGGNSFRTQPQPDVANPNESYDNILRGVMDEHYGTTRR